MSWTATVNTVTIAPEAITVDVSAVNTGLALSFTKLFSFRNPEDIDVSSMLASLRSEANRLENLYNKGTVMKTYEGRSFQL